MWKKHRWRVAAGVGWKGRACHHSQAVLQCGWAHNCHSEPKIHLARRGHGEGKMEDVMMRANEEEEHCRGDAGQESVV